MARIPESEFFVVDGKVYCLQIGPEQLAPNILLVGDPARVVKVARHFDSVEHEVSYRDFSTKTGTCKGVPISVICPGIGTDNNEIAMVECFGLNRFDIVTREEKEEAIPLTFIRVGSSGGIQADVAPGTLAIGEYGLGLDNTGLFYDHPPADAIVTAIEEQAYQILTDASSPDSRFKGKIHPYASKADSKVVSALAANAQGDFVQGITASASGLFGPQGRNLPGLKITIPELAKALSRIDVESKKVYNFEMESSALFHLANQMGYSAGAICPIIANRHTGEFLADYSKSEEQAIQTAIAAMLSLKSA